MKALTAIFVAAIVSTGALGTTAAYAQDACNYEATLKKVIRKLNRLQRTADQIEEAHEISSLPLVIPPIDQVPEDGTMLITKQQIDEIPVTDEVAEIFNTLVSRGNEITLGELGVIGDDLIDQLPCAQGQQFTVYFQTNDGTVHQVRGVCDWGRWWVSIDGGRFTRI